LEPPFSNFKSSLIFAFKIKYTSISSDAQKNLVSSTNDTEARDKQSSHSQLTPPEEVVS
jgi:hypothetical protein